MGRVSGHSSAVRFLVSHSNHLGRMKLPLGLFLVDPNFNDPPNDVFLTDRNHTDGEKPRSIRTQLFYFLGAIYSN